MRPHAIVPTRPLPTVGDGVAQHDQFRPKVISVALTHAIRDRSDEIQGVVPSAISQWTELAVRSVGRQIESGVGGLDRRAKVRKLLADIYWGRNTEREGDVRVVVYNNKNRLDILISRDVRWWVRQRIDLSWIGRNGVCLSGADCETLVEVPLVQHQACAAWFVKQHEAVSRHFEKVLPSAACGSVGR